MKLTGLQVYRIRTKALLTQAAFAEKAGVSLVAVQKWEQGGILTRVSPSMTKLILMEFSSEARACRVLPPPGRRTARETGAASRYGRRTRVSRNRTPGRPGPPGS